MRRTTMMRILILWSVALTVLSALVFAWHGGVALAEPGPVTVLPGEGVSFSQVDYTWPGAEIFNSNTGQVDVEIAALQTSTGLSSGFVNVATTLGWVVQNLPVFSGFPYPTISTKFDLGTTPGDDITSLVAVVEFSSDPVTNFVATPVSPFPVGDTESNAAGKGSLVPIAPVPPPPGAVPFIPGGVLQACVQPGHHNIQTAVNQCGPAAAANSLQWLEDTYGIVVPHPHVLGLCGDGSLVGQFDVTMGRGCPGITRAAGPTITDEAFLEGKLEYLAANGLGGVIVRHQDDGVLGGAKPGGKNYFAHGLTSWGHDAPTEAFIIEQVCKGEDVKLGFTPPGHWVTVVGAGTILGIPGVIFNHDDPQSNDAAGLRTEFAFLVDHDGDTLPNLWNERWDGEVDIVVSQSPPSVGGIVEIPVDTSDAAASAVEGSGSSAPPYAAIAGAAAATVVALTAGAWYARRRLLR